MSNSKKHLNLIKILKTLMSDSKNRTNDFCICIGSTATVIESLENNVDVVHLVFEPIFEVYTSALWRNINTKILDENIFYYNLKKIFEHTYPVNSYDDLEKTFPGPFFNFYISRL